MEDSAFILFLLPHLLISQAIIEGLSPLLKTTTNSLPMFSPMGILNDSPHLTYLLHWMLWTFPEITTPPPTHNVLSSCLSEPHFSVCFPGSASFTLNVDASQGSI